jgi:hypothetical protein
MRRPVQIRRRLALTGMNIMTHRSPRHRLLVAELCSLTLLALAACQSEALPVQDLGNTTDQLSTEPEPPVADPFEGQWLGEAQDIFGILPDGSIPPYAFPSGSTKITLEVSKDETGYEEVRLTFGEGTLPAPERGLAWPPGFDAYAASISSLALFIPPFEGFAYRLERDPGRLIGNEPDLLALQFDRHQPYEEWCALQPSLPQGDGDYDCIGAAGLAGGDPPNDPCIKSNPDGTEEPIDCNLAGLCLPFSVPVCSCDRDGCERTSAVPSSLWLRISGDQLIGSIGTAFETELPGVFLPLGLIRFRRVAD